MKRLRIGFLMDALEGVKVRHDTTFALMLAAQARGHEVRAFEQRDLFFRVDQSYARMRTVSVSRDVVPAFEVLDDEVSALGELEVIFLRKDPPADAEFLNATRLVELTGKRRPFFINRPAGLRDANEKLFGLHAPELFPRTFVSSNPARLHEFIGSTTRTILKPLDGFAGQGILSASSDDDDLHSLLELVTDNARRTVVAQEYLPAIRSGDLRILLLEGEPIGSVLRVPAAHELRANMAAGGSASEGTLGERELAICRRLKPLLAEHGLHFVGIDVIGGFLTEVNVTSPTGLVEADPNEERGLANLVLAWVEDQVKD